MATGRKAAEGCPPAGLQHRSGERSSRKAQAPSSARVGTTRDLSQNGYGSLSPSPAPSPPHPLPLRQGRAAGGGLGAPAGPVRVAPPRRRLTDCLTDSLSDSLAV